MNTVDFEKEVVEKSHELPVLVDFWAPWCGPCKMLGPILEKAHAAAGGKWELVKINVDENPDLAAKYGIRGIPAVKLFHQGKVIDEFTGVIPENAFMKWIEKHIPDENAQLLESIKKEIESGKIEEGRKKLEDFIKNNPSNQAARMYLSKLIYRDDPKRALSLLHDIHPGNEWHPQAEAIKTLATMLSYLESPGRLTESPVKQQYLDAIRSIKEDRWEDAIQNFLDVIFEDKKYDDEGARRAMIAIFTLLGKDHELTKKYRKRFDMSLY